MDWHGPKTSEADTNLVFIQNCICILHTGLFPFEIESEEMMSDLQDVDIQLLNKINKKGNQ